MTLGVQQFETVCPHLRPAAQHLTCICEQVIKLVNTLGVCTDSLLHIANVSAASACTRTFLL